MNRGAVGCGWWRGTGWRLGRWMMQSMTENTERFAAFIADTMVRLSRGVPLAVMRNEDGRWLRVRLDGSGESNATLAMAETNGTLVGVYNIRCPRQWLEEDVRYVETQGQALRKLEQELA